MSTYKRKSGKWAAVICLDPTPSGLMRRRSLGTFATHKEAKQAEREALAAKDRGIDLAPGKVTVADLLTRFIADRKAYAHVVAGAEALAVSTIGERLAL